MQRLWLDRVLGRGVLEMDTDGVERFIFRHECLPEQVALGLARRMVARVGPASCGVIVCQSRDEDDCPASGLWDVTARLTEAEARLVAEQDVAIYRRTQ